MAKIKFCGLKTLYDVYAVNEIFPDYVGFVFAQNSSRLITRSQAEKFRAALSKKILAVGVFVNEDFHTVANLLNEGVIDIAQLHGEEPDSYIQILHGLTKKPIMKTFNEKNMALADYSLADYVLIDSGKGSGKTFDWRKIDLRRKYFLAGGLNAENVTEAIKLLNPFAVDVSSGIETNGRKDFEKMRAFAEAVRKNF